MREKLQQPSSNIQRNPNLKNPKTENRNSKECRNPKESSDLPNFQFQPARHNIRELREIRGKTGFRFSAFEFPSDFGGSSFGFSSSSIGYIGYCLSSIPIHH